MCEEWYILNNKKNEKACFISKTLYTFDHAFHHFLPYETGYPVFA
jgi:hypothetical protein